MIPALITIGPFRVYLFGFFLFVAFIISTYIIYKYGKEDLSEEEYLDAYLYTSIATLISARLIYILLNSEQFGFNILRFIVVREAPGLSLFGGLLGGFFFLAWYTKIKKLPFYYILDIFSIAGSFGLFLAKIGEFVGGAGFGKRTDFLISVRIIGREGSRHPVELYEALLFLILAIFLVLAFKKGQRKKWPEGFIFCLFTINFALIIFILELLKDYTLYLYGLSLRQIGILILLAVIILPVYKRIKIIKSQSIKK